MSLSASCILSSVELPMAELCAARLDGDLFGVADSFCPPDVPETPALRAAALGHGLSARLIVERHTAAWVHGARDSAPGRHQFCASAQLRVKNRPGLLGIDVREVVIDDDEVVCLGGRRVTSTLRTAVDLVRSSPRFDPLTQLTVHRLLTLGSHSVDDCVALLDRRRNLPGKRRALQRLSRC